MKTIFDLLDENNESENKINKYYEEFANMNEEMLEYHLYNSKGKKKEIIIEILKIRENELRNLEI